MEEKDYGIEFEQAYSKISQEDIEALNNSKQIRNDNSAIAVIAIAFLWVIILCAAKLLIGIVALVIWMIGLVIWGVAKQKKQSATRLISNIEHENCKIINKFLSAFEEYSQYTFENKCDGERAHNLYENKLYYAIDRFPQHVGGNSGIGYSSKIPTITAIRGGWIPLNEIKGKLKSGNEFKITNMKYYHCLNSRIHHNIWLYFEAFTEIKLKKNTNLDIYFELEDNKQEIKINNQNSSDEIATQILVSKIQTKLNEYIREFPIEVIIEGDELFLRIGKVKDSKYTTSTLPYKKYLYEVYRTIVSVISVSNELLEIIENS